MAPPEITNADIPGHCVSDEHALRYVGDLNQLLTSKPGTQFPGTQPVSFDRTHLDAITREEYLVCEKTDGIRVLLYMHQSATVLVNRKLEVRTIPLTAPNPRANGFPHVDSVLDCELVWDVDASGVQTLALYVFDMLVCQGKMLLREPLTKRLGYADQTFVRPLNASQVAATQSFVVHLKEMCRTQHVMHVLGRLPWLPHANDGLIFTPVNRPYCSGTDRRLLKWKPGYLNTADFILVPEEGFYAIHVTSRGVRTPYGYIRLDADHLASIHAAGVRVTDLVVIECCWDARRSADTPHGVAHGSWKFMRVRTDKTTPNDENVVRKIVQSIQDTVSGEDLVATLTRPARS